MHCRYFSKIKIKTGEIEMLNLENKVIIIIGEEIAKILAKSGRESSLKHKTRGVA